MSILGGAVTDATGSALIGSLVVALGVDAKPLVDGTKQAEASLRSVSSTMTKVVGVAAKLGSAAAAAGVAIVAGLVKSGLSAIDTHTKLARTLDATYDGLRGLQIAAQDAGVETSQLNKSLEQITKRIGEAIRDPASQASQALSALGLNALELANMDIDERFAVIADRIREMGLNSAQTADILRQLGVRSAQMANLLRDGGDAIRAARQEVDDFGLSMSEVDAAKIELANDAMSRISRALEGVRNQLTVAIAPILLEIAERFKALAKENGGWAEMAQRAIQAVMRSLTKVADVVQGLRVAWKGLELVAVGFGAAVVSAIQIAVEAVVKFNDTILEAVNFTIRQLNRLPKVEMATIDPFTNSSFMQGFRGMADSMRNQVGETRAELHELAMQEMPSAKLEKFFEDVQQRAQEAAEKVVAARHEMGDEAVEGFEFEDDRERREAEEAAAAAEQERFQEMLDSKLEALREFIASEEELEVANHQRRLEDLEELLENERILEDEYRALREELENEHMDRIAQIRERGMSDLEKFTESSFKDQASTVFQQLANMTSGVATHNKKMFELNKIAGIANAVISTHAGVAKALEAYPPPLSFAMAAAQAAAGFAQVQAIRSQSFGGANAAPSLAGSTPAPPVTPVGGEQAADGGGGREQRRVFALEGIDPDRMFSGRQLRNLWESLMEVVEDGNRAGIRTDVVFT